jgi:hypothetical protein
MLLQIKRNLRQRQRIRLDGRKHFPLLVGAPLAEFAAIASRLPEPPAGYADCRSSADLPRRREAQSRTRRKNEDFKSFEDLPEADTTLVKPSARE